MWFDSWSDVFRVLLVGAAAYVTLVVLLRVSGKRTLAKLNAFDLVVTVALGSTLSTILLNSTVSWSEGAVGLAALVLLQYFVAAVSARLPGSRAVVTARPTVLLRDGELLQHKLSAQRVNPEEVRQAVRSTGAGDLALVAAVVLETDGTMSVITRQQAGDGSAIPQQ